MYEASNYFFNQPETELYITNDFQLSLLNFVPMEEMRNIKKSIKIFLLNYFFLSTLMSKTS